MQARICTCKYYFKEGNLNLNNRLSGRKRDKFQYDLFLFCKTQAFVLVYTEPLPRSRISWSDWLTSMGHKGREKWSTVLFHLTLLQKTVQSQGTPSNPTSLGELLPALWRYEAENIGYRIWEGRSGREKQPVLWNHPQISALNSACSIDVLGIFIVIWKQLTWKLLSETWGIFKYIIYSVSSKDSTIFLILGKIPKKCFQEFYSSLRSITTQVGMERLAKTDIDRQTLFLQGVLEPSPLPYHTYHKIYTNFCYSIPFTL